MLLTTYGYINSASIFDKIGNNVILTSVRKLKIPLKFVEVEGRNPQLLTNFGKDIVGDTLQYLSCPSGLYLVCAVFIEPCDIKWSMSRDAIRPTFWNPYCGKAYCFFKNLHKMGHLLF